MRVAVASWPRFRQLCVRDTSVSRIYSTSTVRSWMSEWLLDCGADPNASNDTGCTPLHLAAAHLQLETILLLLEHKADVNPRDSDGVTPLHDTMFNLPSLLPEGQCIDVMQRLLEHGADPNACDNNHSTPLHTASSKGLLEVARVLLSHGANVVEKDGKGRTPFQVASSNGHDEMTKLLLEHGAVAQP
ncbi:ankyrin repeat-containing domain protein [Lactarius akahatsu]|uniref:Ankyrin repeat-containing domain protein n=1 Tax=Lactarius akahatsu TaxID=416441 RepID=A0AAD4Q3C8_9AGAM|nr:ankyrin repeat-containing domain protein [Lactarius akahatsu]